MLFLVGLLFASTSRAQDVAQSCDQSTLDAVGTFLHVKKFQQASYQDQTEAVVAASCKAWPKDTNIVLVAAAYRLPSDPKRPDDQADRHFVVAMVDASRSAVVSSFKGMVSQDATLQIQGHDDFRLDTARYDLAPGVRAFGVIFVGGQEPQAADNWASDYLVLFVPDGPKLRHVLEVPLEQIEGSNASHLTIGVEKTSSHGFADLSITARNETDEKSKGARTILQYNGKSYGENDGNFQSAYDEIFQ
ncbi:hypothetical protein [Dyella mobilis]|uniref:Carbohydrate-binding domain-containing protein n=1 Tax=Dyella mobilis TaxID=1849582 RepID=A0ABS2KEF0_9GAMM|nr:hypothetical protein [Dyella mobilis]MBM7129546.1 hypothetical protein [Dyella mobilis]GLQ98190.1 hypothetical protein GCM10007863_26100 [Dyella mobilis]